MIEILTAFSIALFLIAVREGLVIKDMRDNKPSPFESTWWHRIGVAIRGFIILGMFLILQPTGALMWPWMISSFLIAGVWYNIAINLINKLPWYYVGTTASTDKLIRKIYKFFKIKLN